MAKMCSEILVFIIITCCCGLNFGKELNNSTVVTESNDNFNKNSTYFNYNGTINRIVGGKPINIAKVPYQIALYNNGEFICGGSIISADWVLTAAHCVKGGGRFAVRAGSRYVGRRGQIRYTRVVVINSGYNANTLKHDIALIRVDTAFKWSNEVRPIRIAKPRWKLPQKYLISGWGTRQENSNKVTYGLRGATVNNISQKRCKALYKNQSPISKYMICAASAGKDACQGDSGGPLALNRVQYGIVSFGIGCARSNYPGIYTNLRREYSWIKKVVKRYGGKMPN